MPTAPGKSLRVLALACLVLSGLGLATIVCAGLLEGGSNWFARHIDLDNNVIPIGALMIMVGIPGTLIFWRFGNKYRNQVAAAKFASWLQQMRNLSANERCLTGKPLPSRLGSSAWIIIGFALVLIGFMQKEPVILLVWIGFALGIRGLIQWEKSSPLNCPHCRSGLQYLAKVPVRVSEGTVFQCTTCGTIWIPARAGYAEPSWKRKLSTLAFGLVGGLLSSAIGSALNTKGTPAIILVKGSDAKEETGWTPLHEAALKGDKEGAELLLDKQADVNAKDKDGKTPLHVAAEKGHKNVVELLLGWNAGAEDRTNDGLTPLNLAADNNHEAVVELLRRHGDYK